MIGGFELVAVSGDTRQHLPGGAFALAESGGGEHATRDHAGKKMPWLRVQPDLERDVLGAHRLQGLVELAKGLRGERAGRFEEHFEHPRPLPPGERLRTPHRILFDHAFTLASVDVSRACRRRPRARPRPGGTAEHDLDDARDDAERYAEPPGEVVVAEHVEDHAAAPG